MKTATLHAATCPIRVALFQESVGNAEGWIAQCVGTHLCAQGASREDALKGIKQVIRTYFFLQNEGQVTQPNVRKSMEVFGKESESELVLA